MLRSYSDESHRVIYFLLPLLLFLYFLKEYLWLAVWLFVVTLNVKYILERIYSSALIPQVRAFARLQETTKWSNLGLEEEPATPGVVLVVYDELPTILTSAITIPELCIIQEGNNILKTFISINGISTELAEKKICSTWLPGVTEVLGMWVWGRTVEWGCWWHEVRADPTILLGSRGMYSDQLDGIGMVVPHCQPGILWRVRKGKGTGPNFWGMQMRQAQLLSKNMLQWGHATKFYCFLFQKSGTPKSWICHFCMICSQQTLGNDCYNTMLHRIALNLWMYTFGTITTICWMWFLN